MSTAGVAVCFRCMRCDINKRSLLGVKFGGKKRDEREIGMPTFFLLGAFSLTGRSGGHDVIRPRQRRRSAALCLLAHFVTLSLLAGSSRSSVDAASGGSATTDPRAMIGPSILKSDSQDEDIIVSSGQGWGSGSGHLDLENFGDTEGDDDEGRNIFDENLI